jgi:putative membrane protein
MPKRFLTDPAKQALTAAIRAIEQRSSAEVVIAVRARSASYLHADLIAGALAGVGALAFLLYSSWSFPVWSILVEPIVVGGLVGAAGSRVPALRRLLTPAAVRARWVRRDAQATFCDKRVRSTRDRTGVLVYIALTEQRAEVIADTGVEDAVDPETWRRGVAAVDAAVAAGGDGQVVAAAIEKLGDVLAPVLARSADDVNELPDEVCA